MASGTTDGTAVYGGQIGPADVRNAGGLSPYGTMAQSGNIEENVESAIDGVNNSSIEHRLSLGGFFRDESKQMRRRLGSNMTRENNALGFRLASVAE